MANEGTVLVLLVVLTLGLFVPELLKKVRLPVISIIILTGAIFGQHGFDLVESNEVISFFGFLGMTFLMLMAGLETDLRTLKKSRKKVIIMALINGGIPFFVGLATTWLFGYSLTTSVLVGIIFISSSVAMIVPTLQSCSNIKKEISQRILAAVLIADIVSLIALGFIFQNTETIANLPLQLHFLVLAIIVVFIFYLTPRLSSYVFKRRFRNDEGYERQLRFILVVMIGILSIFTILGVHPILAAFLAGLSLSSITRKDKSGVILTKIHTLGYGLFVPVFFFIVGMDMDLKLLTSINIGNIMVPIIIIGLITSKIFSGYLAGRLTRMSRLNSWIFGSVSITQLTTTLAVTYSAESLGLLDNLLVTTIILLSIITTFVGPLLSTYISNRIVKTP